MPELSLVAWLLEAERRRPVGIRFDWRLRRWRVTATGRFIAAQPDWDDWRMTALVPPTKESPDDLAWLEAQLRRRLEGPA